MATKVGLLQLYFPGKEKEIVYFFLNLTNAFFVPFFQSRMTHILPQEVVAPSFIEANSLLMKERRLSSDNWKGDS